MHIIFRLLPLLFATTAYSSEFYKTLLYGSKFKGFLKIAPIREGEYVVSFEVKETQGNVTWSLHMSSAPYDMAVMTDNCKRVKKSPHIKRDLPLNDTTVKEADILGHTIVIARGDEVLACATIILPEQPLLSASFHVDPIEGHVHVIQMKDQVRILPDLRYFDKYEDIEPTKAIIEWAFVENCDSPNAQRHTDGTELGVDSRTTLSTSAPTNFSLEYFSMTRGGQPFVCALLTVVEPRVVMGLDLGLSQQNYYESVHATTEPVPDQLHIRDDCLDISTESVYDRYDNFYPSVNIFGPESLMLKSSIEGSECAVLRPQFPRPASTAYFLHPILGSYVLLIVITIVDTDDKILMTGELRHVFENTSTRATVQISSKWTGPAGCPQYQDCDDCHTIEDAAIVVGREDKTVSLSGVFPWFNVIEMRSVIVDLQWAKVCANLTYLPTGAISAHALFKRVSPVSAPTVASILALEYPANNYTEVLINKRQSFSGAVAHARPLDSSITSGPPCGEQNLGPVKKVFWTERLKYILGSELNDTSAFIWFNMVTGKFSILGTSVLLSDDNEVYCGDFEPLTEKTIAVAIFEEPYKGYIKLTQYSSFNWASGLPTQVYYSLKETNASSVAVQDDLLDWDFVNADNMTCKGAMLYNPFGVNVSDCNPFNSQFCPLGSASVKSSPLSLNSRQHMVIHDTPLTGPFSVIGKSIRIRTRGKDQTFTCAPLTIFSQATFRWIVTSNQTLTNVQETFAKRVNVELFQVEVDYTREFYQSRCSIYRLTILAEDDKLAEILDVFDVEKKRFKDDDSLSCDNGKKVSSSLPSDTLPRATVPASSTLIARISLPLLVSLIVSIL